MADLTFEHHGPIEGKHYRVFAVTPDNKIAGMHEYKVDGGALHVTNDASGKGPEVAGALHQEMLRRHPDLPLASDKPKQAEPEHEPETFYHGTTRPGLKHIRPAGPSGRVTFNSDTDRSHAYATSSQDDAWHYAEMAEHASERGHGRVYEVRPKGHYEKDPAVDAHGRPRSNFSNDYRSKHGWEVVREIRHRKEAAMEPPLRLHDEQWVDDRHTQGRITAVHPDHGTVGHLDYRAHRGQLSVRRLAVTRGGRDTGEALLDRMVELHPKVRFPTGGRTAALRPFLGEAGLDEVQGRALHRLSHLPEMIQGDDAHQLFAEHGIHLHEEDPWEAGEVDDDHLTRGDTGASVHHPADRELHTSQNYLSRSGLEHFIRHPWDGPHGDGPHGDGPRDERPSTWEHQGQHWINGGHHRLLADRMTYRRGTTVSDRTARTAARRPFARKAGVSTDPGHVHEDPSTWGEEYRTYATQYPHAAAVGQAQEKARFEHPRLTMPLAKDPDEASSSIQHLLRKGGHPWADNGFVMKHPNPDKGTSNVVYDHSERSCGAALHPSKWDYGTLAHETAHLLDHWERGKLGDQNATDEETHGPNFVKHYTNTLRSLDKHAPDTFQDAHQEALERTKGHARREARRRPFVHESARTEPSARLFGKTYGLDPRLWDGEHLRPEIRADILTTFAAFCARHGFQEPDSWARLVFFGSEASGWTSETLEGNGDLDLSLGVEYTRFRAVNRSWVDEPDEGIASALTELMHAELNDPGKHFGDAGPFDQTWFCNPLGYRIEQIKPYAAYDVSNDSWVVRPPRLEHWSIEDFPQGHPLHQQCRAVEAEVRAVLKMPEPYRTQQADALWHYLHADRGRAFSGQGEGWFDSGNVIEKWLSQVGEPSLWDQLAALHFQAVNNPHLLDAPADWSNEPAQVS